MVAAAVGIEFANAATAIAILTIFINPMTADFGWTRTELAGATSLGAVLGASLAPFMGRLVDRRGARLPLVLGGVLVASACMYLASVQSLLGFYVAFTITRTADQGLIKIGAPTAVGKWFQRRRGRAIALVFFGGSAGIIILAPVVQLVIGLWGWRVAWRLLGVLMLCLGVLPCLAFIRKEPEDIEQGDGGEPYSAEQGGDGTTEGGPWAMGDVVRTPAFWLVLLSLFLGSASSAGVTLHLVPHLTQRGISAGEAVGVISLMSATGGGGILAMGFLSERMSPGYLMACLYLLSAAGIVVLLTVSSVGQAYLFGVLHGVASGGVNALAPILWANYYGRDILGSLHGLSRACQVAGFALGPLVLGIAFDASGEYGSALRYFALAAVGEFLLVLLSRLPRSSRAG